LDEHYRVRTKEAGWYSDKQPQRDELADIYSVGAIFFHALTGAPPALKDSVLVKTKAFVSLSFDMQQLISRMLSKYREDRPQSVESIVSELLPMVEEQKTQIKVMPKKSKQTVEVVERIKCQRVNLLTIMILLMLTMSLTLNGLLLSGQGLFIKESLLEYLLKLFPGL
jgi:serine/threonine protein kinase